MQLLTPRIAWRRLTVDSKGAIVSDVNASARMGRPPIEPGSVRRLLVSVRVTPSEQEEIAAAARDNDLPVSSFARRVLLRAIREQS